MGLTIGKLAKKADISVETVRYYERSGLIKRPVKPDIGYRQHEQESLQRLLFIKKTKTLGFSLDEIGSLLVLSEGRCADVQSLASESSLRCINMERNMKPNCTLNFTLRLSSK